MALVFSGERAVFVSDAGVRHATRETLMDVDRCEVFAVEHADTRFPQAAVFGACASTRRTYGAWGDPLQRWHDEVHGTKRFETLLDRGTALHKWLKSLAWQ